MDFKDLRYFRVVAQCGTFSKAAASLRVAQPALSRQVQKLEHRLGVELLRRSTRGVTLTEAGQALLRRIVQFEAEFEETRLEMAQFADRPAGSLRVAVQSSMSIVMVPELVKRYRASHPEVALELTEGFSGDLIDALLEKRIDVAVVDAPSHPHADLDCSPLWIEALQLVFPSNHADAARLAARPATIQDLAELPIIMPGRRYAIRRLVDAAFERQRMTFKPTFEANGPLMIYALVRAGLGLTLMPPGASFPWIASGELQAVGTRPSIRRTVSVIAQASMLKEQKVASFRKLVKSMAPKIAKTQRFGHAALYLTDGMQPDGTLAERPMPIKHRAMPTHGVAQTTLPAGR